MRDSDIDITEDDLRIFPPYVSSFLLVSLLMMVSHGFSAALLFIFYLDIPIGFDFGASIASMIIFVVLNMRLIYGHLSSIIGLQILAVCHFLIALLFFFTDVDAPQLVWIAITVLISSTSAIILIRSRRYEIMARFLARIWLFYRSTGRSILQELDRQRQEAAQRR